MKLSALVIVLVSLCPMASMASMASFSEYYDCHLSGEDGNWIVAFGLNDDQNDQKSQVMSYRENAPCTKDASCRTRTFEKNIRGDIVKFTRNVKLLQTPLYTEGFHDDIEFDRKTLKIKYQQKSVSIIGSSAEHWFNGLCKLRQ